MANQNKLWLAKVSVTLKNGVLDPQGKAVLHGLQDLGFSGVADVRVGKHIEVRLEAASKQEAESRVSEMAAKLLANPVMERFQIAIEDV